MRRNRPPALLLGLVLAGACASPSEDAPPFVPAPPLLHRLTRTQYQLTVRDLLGEPLALPTDLEADTPLHGFSTIGAGELSVSPRAVEQYELAAYDLAGQVFRDPQRRLTLMGCTPAATNDPCIREFLSRFGQRAFRRPLSAAELDQLTDLAQQLGDGAASPVTGVEQTVAALLQSPHFLYRVERGEPDPEHPGRLRYSGWEMASRLSYFLTNSMPDDALLAAAVSGELLTVEGIQAQALRLLKTRPARDALAGFFVEHLDLNELDTLGKDRAAFPQFSPSLAASMRSDWSWLSASPSPSTSRRCAGGR